MKNTIDRKLDLMARSLQEHINLAKELNLNFVAQLLTMTAMEIRINLHGISDQEIDTLCARPSSDSVEPEERETARVINFPRSRPVFLSGFAAPVFLDGSARENGCGLAAFLVWRGSDPAKSLALPAFVRGVSTFKSQRFWRFADVIFCIKSCPDFCSGIRHIWGDVLDSAGVCGA